MSATAESGRRTPRGTDLRTAPARGLRVAAYSTYLLLGWASITLPSTIREVKGEFGQTDAGIGFAYFVYSLIYMTASLGSGVMTQRVDRRSLLPSGAVLIAVGLVATGFAPSWLAFVAAYVIAGIGAGILNPGINALFIDMFAHRPGGAMNRLHLCYSVGALAAPALIGIAIQIGLPWRAAFAITGAVALAVAVLLRSPDMPPARRRDEAAVSGGQSPRFGAVVPAALVALALAIAMYPPMQMGVSSWLVEYLGEVELGIATTGLSAFLGGVALGRYVSSLVADRFSPVPYAATLSLAAGSLIILAVVMPIVPLKLACFALAGLAAGPVYPMIMVIAGLYFPGRASIASSFLTTAAILGLVIYPPLMGWVAEHAGLAPGMFGAGMFGVACAVILVIAGRLDPRKGSTTPRPDQLEPEWPAP